MFHNEVYLVYGIFKSGSDCMISCFLVFVFLQYCKMITSCSC